MITSPMVRADVARGQVLAGGETEPRLAFRK
jgi:hypothetical protein